MIFPNRLGLKRRLRNFWRNIISLPALLRSLVSQINCWQRCMRRGPISYSFWTLRFEMRRWRGWKWLERFGIGILMLSSSLWRLTQSLCPCLFATKCLLWTTLIRPCQQRSLNLVSRQPSSMPIVKIVKVWRKIVFTLNQNLPNSSILLKRFITLKHRPEPIVLFSIPRQTGWNLQRV